MKKYLTEFQSYAQCVLDKTGSVKRIGRYAELLNLRANKLLRVATKNNYIDLRKLQTQLFETGRDYVKKFADTFR